MPWRISRMTRQRTRDRRHPKREDVHTRQRSEDRCFIFTETARKIFFRAEFLGIQILYFGVFAIKGKDIADECIGKEKGIQHCNHGHNFGTEIRHQHHQNKT